VHELASGSPDSATRTFRDNLTVNDTVVLIGDI
jgi:hypothetical protein